MTMGEIIKMLRINAKMTQEELGEKLGVQKSAIRKYEKGEVENIKRSTIKKMADLFNVSPCYIMGWEDAFNPNGKLEKEVSLIEAVQNQYGKEAIQILQLLSESKDNMKSTLDMLNMYDQLDSEDKAEIRGEMKHMLKDEKYSVKKEYKNA